MINARRECILELKLIKIEEVRLIILRIYNPFLTISLIHQHTQLI